MIALPVRERNYTTNWFWGDIHAKGEKFLFAHVLHCGMFSGRVCELCEVLFVSFALVGNCELCETLCVSFAPMPVVLSFYLFLRCRHLIRALDLHVIGVEPFSAFSWGIMCFCLSCVESLLLSLGTETSHFERSCACLFIWLLDLLDELYFHFLLLVLFETKNLCWVLSMHSSRRRLRTNGGYPWMMSDWQRCMYLMYLLDRNVQELDAMWRSMACGEGQPKGSSRWTKGGEGWTRVV